MSEKYEVFFNGDKIAELYSPIYLSTFLKYAVLIDRSLFELKVTVSPRTSSAGPGAMR